MSFEHAMNHQLKEFVLSQLRERKRSKRVKYLVKMYINFTNHENHLNLRADLHQARVQASVLQFECVCHAIQGLQFRYFGF